MIAVMAIKSISPTEIIQTLTNHKKWISGDGGTRADFTTTDLIGFNFTKI